MAVALNFSACYHEQQIPVIADFDYTVAEGSYTIPVELNITNKTSGADFYLWTFEGATPTSSDKKQPGTVRYALAGTYSVKLEAWNDMQRSMKEITVTLDSAVVLNFDVSVLVNDYAPATARITNNARGASSYQWIFEGGTPATSTSANPPDVVFATAGEHAVTLTVSNGRENYTTTKTVLVREQLQAAFVIVPSFEDDDYEAPLTASLVNNTTSGLHFTWKSSGGVITDHTSKDTQIYFASPGQYAITLTADNDKETQVVEQTITIKPNSNLYVMNDVKLGVSAAHAAIGCFYASPLRDVLPKDEVTLANGNKIDLAFYGINSTFGYCRFISPDSAAKFTFPEIPQATHTYFVNTQESTPLSMTTPNFDAMITDAPLQGMDIKINDTGTKFFTNASVPRVVLFETADGRKGAIKIKAFVADGSQSYVLVDIKVQKEKP